MPLYSLLQSLHASFSWSAQRNIWKSKYFFHLQLLWRLNCSETFSPFCFTGTLLMIETDRSWQILFITIKLKTFVGPTQPAHCPGCLNRLWRSAGPCSLGLQSWWRARRNHTIQLSEEPLWSYRGNSEHGQSGRICILGLEETCPQWKGLWFPSQAFWTRLVYL